jgi:hypothetical protein
MLLHLIADYGLGDLAFAEVRQRLGMLLPDAAVVVTSVGPFDTLGAGFCIGQLALNDGPQDMVLYANIAPRQDEEDPRRDNAGERLVAARLASGALVVAPNAGYTFSFLRDEAEELREVEVPEAGSQFRSRDLFPDVVARLARGDIGPLGSPLPDEAVPAFPERVVAYTDGYGNLKTTWTELPAQPGARVGIAVGDQRGFAVVSDGAFEVPVGETSFAPGSSGWRRRSGGSVAFLELFRRGSSAAALFGHPPAGTAVEVVA